MDEGWQERLVEDLRKVCEADLDVRGLFLFGSLADSEKQVDVWSDVDAALVVQDDSLPAYADADGWLATLGAPLAVVREAHPGYTTVRTCFVDGRRLDLVLASVSGVSSRSRWTLHDLGPGRWLLYRGPEVDGLLAGPPEPAVVEPVGLPGAEDFWFCSVMASVKVARGDLLVASHLALSLLQRVCELAMLQRDLATGTRHHRRPSRDRFLPDLIGIRDLRDEEQILDAVVSCAEEYDRLGAQMGATPCPRSAAVVEIVRQVRRHLQSTRLT